VGFVKAVTAELLVQVSTETFLAFGLAAVVLPVGQDWRDRMAGLEGVVWWLRSDRRRCVPGSLLPSCGGCVMRQP